MDTSRKQAGFTLIEVMMVIVIMGVLLTAIMSTGETTTQAVRANNRSASASETSRRLIQRLAPLMRAGLLSTMRVKATAADVEAAQAAQLLDPSVVVPAVGDWISPVDDDPRDNLRFESAEGIFTMSGIPLSNVSNTTGPQAFEFVREDSEAANGVDDDGDGLIDEGRLEMTTDTLHIVLGRGIERCTFSLHGRIIHMILTCAAADGANKVARATYDYSVYMRNN
jgi:prepilin-type N-terminal cleavage/methylation domain-containing protein